MKKIILLIVLITTFLGGLKAELPNGLINTNSDSYFVISFGPNYCFSDANNSKSIIGPFINQSPLQNWDISVGYKKKFHTNLGYKIGFSVDNFTGNDIPPTKNNRSYSFQSNLIQLTVQGEYSFYFETDCFCKDPNYLYGFAGTGVMASNANLNNSNQIFKSYKYKKNDIAPVVFLGIGYLYHISNKLAIGAEYKIEYPFSDYIDGFKPPLPDSKFNDLIQGFSVSLNLKF